jgi:hypothetical protein
MIYEVIRDISDIDTAIRALVNEAVEIEREEVETEFNMKLDDLRDENEALRQTIRELQQELENIDR